MAGNKYLADINGRLSEVSSNQSSAGAGDAGKIPALDSGGKLDTSFLPTGIGAETFSVVASEALSAGNFVNLWNNAGTINVRKADATAAGKEADGFVLSAFSSSATASVYMAGINNALTGLTPGSYYFLDTTAGGINTTAPSASGNVVQSIGRAEATTSIAFQPDGRGWVKA